MTLYKKVWGDQEYIKAKPLKARRGQASAILHVGDGVIPGIWHRWVAHAHESTLLTIPLFRARKGPEPYAFDCS